MKVQLVDWESAKAIGKARGWDGTDDHYVFGIGFYYLPWGEVVEAESYSIEHDLYFIDGFGVPVCLTERG